jgi:SAM-dependent methyltransferase
MGLIGGIHGGWVHPRRTTRLQEILSSFVKSNSSVLDVGCGDGLVSSRIAASVPGVKIVGCDVLVRPHTYIPVEKYDSKVLPYRDSSFDLVMLIDVLHHAESPDRLLREAARVSRGPILIKDHVRSGWLGYETLRLMDWFGNAYAGVALPYNYWREDEWTAQIRNSGLQANSWFTKLDLYPWPLTLLFDRSLHVVTLLDRATAQ